MTLPRSFERLGELGNNAIGHYEPVSRARRAAKRWVPINPSTGLSGPRMCDDCSAELQHATAHGLRILRCPWTLEGDRLSATSPIWTCGRPYTRASRTL